MAGIRRFSTRIPDAFFPLPKTEGSVAAAAAAAAAPVVAAAALSMVAEKDHPDYLEVLQDARDGVAYRCSAAEYG